MRIPLHAADTPVTALAGPACADSAPIARARAPTSFVTTTGMPTACASRAAIGAPSVRPFAQPDGRMREEIGGAQPVGDLRARHRADEPQRNLERGGEPGQARPFRSVAENDHLRASRRRRTRRGRARRREAEPRAP